MMAGAMLGAAGTGRPIIVDALFAARLRCVPET